VQITALCNGTPFKQPNFLIYLDTLQSNLSFLIAYFSFIFFSSLCSSSSFSISSSLVLQSDSLNAGFLQTCPDGQTPYWEDQSFKSSTFTRKHNSRVQRNMKNINSAASSEHATRVFKKINAMFDPDFHCYRPLYFSYNTAGPLRQRNTKGCANGNCSLLSVNGNCSLLSVNGNCSLLSVNGNCSLLSVNGNCSLLSVNQVKR
jgi:hypothetical protein